MKQNAKRIDSTNLFTVIGHAKGICSIEMRQALYLEHHHRCQAKKCMTTRQKLKAIKQ